MTCWGFPGVNFTFSQLLHDMVSLGFRFQREPQINNRKRFGGKYSYTRPTVNFVDNHVRVEYDVQFTSDKYLSKRYYSMLNKGIP